LEVTGAGFVEAFADRHNVFDLWHTYVAAMALVIHAELFPAAEAQTHSD
jgi:hypothetical protein